MLRTMRSARNIPVARRVVLVSQRSASSRLLAALAGLAALALAIRFPAEAAELVRQSLAVLAGLADRLIDLASER